MDLKTGEKREKGLDAFRSLGVPAGGVLCGLASGEADEEAGAVAHEARERAPELVVDEVLARRGGVVAHLLVHRPDREVEHGRAEHDEQHDGGRVRAAARGRGRAVVGAVPARLAAVDVERVRAAVRGRRDVAQRGHRGRGVAVQVHGHAVRPARAARGPARVRHGDVVARRAAGHARERPVLRAQAPAREVRARAVAEAHGRVVPAQRGLAAEVHVVVVQLRVRRVQVVGAPRLVVQRREVKAVRRPRLVVVHHRRAVRLGCGRAAP